MNVARFSQKKLPSVHPEIDDIKMVLSAVSDQQPAEQIGILTFSLNADCPHQEMEISG